MAQCHLVSLCDSKGLVSTAVGRASGNATEFYPHMPYQAKDKIMLLIQKLEEKKQYLMKLILGMFIQKLPRLHNQT